MSLQPIRIEGSFEADVRINPVDGVDGLVLSEFLIREYTGGQFGVELYGRKTMPTTKSFFWNIPNMPSKNQNTCIVTNVISTWVSLSQNAICLNFQIPVALSIDETLCRCCIRITASSAKIRLIVVLNDIDQSAKHTFRSCVYISSYLVVISSSNHYLQAWS